MNTETTSADASLKTCNSSSVSLLATVILVSDEDDGAELAASHQFLQVKG